MENNREEILKQKLEQELQWIKYRIKMLDLMESKMVKMKKLAEYIKDNELKEEKIDEINIKFKNLESQVNALDEESRN